MAIRIWTENNVRHRIFDIFALSVEWLNGLKVCRVPCNSFRMNAVATQTFLPNSGNFKKFFCSPFTRHYSQLMTIGFTWCTDTHTLQWWHRWLNEFHIFRRTQHSVDHSRSSLIPSNGPTSTAATLHFEYILTVSSFCFGPLSVRVFST